MAIVVLRSVYFEVFHTYNILVSITTTAYIYTNVHMSWIMSLPCIGQESYLFFFVSIGSMNFGSMKIVSLGSMMLIYSNIESTSYIHNCNKHKFVNISFF